MTATFGEENEMRYPYSAAARATAGFLVGGLLALALPAVAKAQAPKVLLIGDSWAAQQWEDGSHATVFGVHGAQHHLVVGETTTESGSTAQEWADPQRLAVIAQALAANPQIDTAQITIGGNDFLDAWSTGLSPAQELALQELIRDDLKTVVDHLLEHRPDMDIVVSLYDYPNFRDTLGSLAGLVCQPLHTSLGAPTPLQLNTAMMSFEAMLADSLTAHPRVNLVSHAGQMQFTYGLASDGIAPGQLLPPGDPSLPSPVAAMRDHGFLGRDCFHLTPAGYDVLVQNLYENYFQVRFDTLLKSPFE
ncbi:MAG: hypothetical protein M0Q42_02805 [Xanthomonadales bacterium]|nr:hypothetical protein [Xanthomonadales bacterium]